MIPADHHRPGTCGFGARQRYFLRSVGQSFVRPEVRGGCVSGLRALVQRALFHLRPAPRRCPAGRPDFFCQGARLRRSSSSSRRSRARSAWSSPVICSTPPSSPEAAPRRDRRRGGRAADDHGHQGVQAGLRWSEDLPRGRRPRPGHPDRQPRPPDRAPGGAGGAARGDRPDAGCSRPGPLLDQRGGVPLPGR